MNSLPGPVPATRAAAPEPLARRVKEIRLSDRARSWIIAAMAFACVLIYLSIWVTYAGIHTYDRFRQLPPGASTNVQGVNYRVVKLTRTPVVVDGDETDPAPSGTIFVVAVLEVIAPTKKTTCTTELVGDGKRTWNPAEVFFQRKLPQFCGEDEHPITPNKPWRLEQIYVIPEKYAGRLFGVAITDLSSGAPNPVLTPPGQ